MTKWGCAIGALMVGALPMAAYAQDAGAPTAEPAPPLTDSAAPAQQQTPPAEAEEQVGDEIVVTGQVRGAVPGDVKPEIQLSPADIRSYGASNVTELMNALSAQLGSGSGRGSEQPVILLSGRRSSFAEIRNIPTEAIERMDILPEEAALQFGYGANQKVVNFVLRRRFQAVTSVVEGAMPTAGGNSGQGFNANLQSIRRDERIELDIKYGQNSGLLESERGVTRAPTTLFDTLGNITGLNGGEIDPALSALTGGVATEAGVPPGANGTAPTLAGFAGTAGTRNVSDLAPYRTLTGGGVARQFGDTTAPLSGTPQKNFEITGTYRPAISQTVSAVATLGFTSRHTDTLLGLPSATLVLPAGNPFSPFTRDVELYRYYDNLPALARSNDNRAINGNVTINGTTSPWLASWGWSLQGEYQYNETKTVTAAGIDVTGAQGLLEAGDPRFNPFGPIDASLFSLRPDQIAKSNSNRATIDFSTFGSLFKLPADYVRASLRVLGRTQRQHSESWIANQYRGGDTARDSISIRGNVTLPLTSRRTGVLAAIGDLSITGNLEVEQLSDFGRLTSTTYGLNWSPVPQVRANFSFNDDRNAPDPGQLGNPVLVTPNRRVFDFVRNESVDITAIEGGNPRLPADNRHVFNARVSIRPFTETNFGLNAAFSDSRTRNGILSFPGATAEIEAAFPDRFVRDTDGRLLSVDYRPINVDRQDRTQLRWGIDFSIPIASPQAKLMQSRMTAYRAAVVESRRTGQPLPPEFTAQQEQFRRLGQQQSLFGGNQRRSQGEGRGEGQPQGQNQANAEPNRERGEGPRQGPGAGGFRGGAGGGGFRGPGGGGNRGNQIRFNLNHVWLLKDEIVIRPGLPAIDRLDGSSAQGVAAHQIDGLIAVKRDAWLLQANGRWQSGWQRTTGALGSPTQLDFGSLATIGLLAEYNPGQDFDAILKHPWLRGSRVQLRLDNVFNARQRVTDQDGVVPAAYVPNLVDPFGRIVRLTFRKQFF